MRYRSNSVENTNASARTISEVMSPKISFVDPSILSSETRINVEGSLEVINYDPIVGDVRNPSTTELKQIIGGNFAAQQRAVTSQDYKALTYSMPSDFGAIKRCSIDRDSDSFRRNLNLYVMCEDNNGALTPANNTIKTNLKTWLGQNKIINDTIDILDAKIVNIGIRYFAIGAIGVNKYETLVSANNKLKEMFRQKMDIGEPFQITDIYSTLNRVRGIADVQNVKIENITGTGYSNVSYNIGENTTADGRFVNVPKNVVFEVKYLDTDIIGNIE